MSSDFLRHNPNTPLFAWASVSITSDTLGALGVTHFPILDIYGELDIPQVLDNNAARAQVIRKIKAARQVMVPNADHFFVDQLDALVLSIKDFLDQTLPLGR